jgi:hypothetical protein
LAEKKNPESKGEKNEENEENHACPTRGRILGR